MSIKTTKNGKFLLLSLTCFICLFITPSCTKEFSCENCLPDPTSKKPPIANAGIDQTLLLPVDSTKLDGSASLDADGSIVTVTWTHISGPSPISIISGNNLITTAKNFTAGVYQFELQVTDNDGLSSKDTVQVLVDHASQNQPPVAVAGPDITIVLPMNSVTLNGTASYDPDHNIAGYQWEKISGPNAFTISNSTSVQTQVTNLVSGTYSFQLNVTDSTGLFSKDTISVVVQPAAQSNCSIQYSTLSTLPFPQTSYKTIIAGNKIIIAGGFGYHSVTGPFPSGRVAMLDLNSLQWSVFELDHGGHMAVIANGDQVFFAGGTQINTNGVLSSKVDIYNISGNSWTSTSLSESRINLRAAAAGNKVLFAGGLTSNGASRRVDVFDQPSGIWSTLNFNYDIGNLATLDHMVVFANRPNGIDIYNANNDSWSASMHSMDQHNVSIGTLGTKFYLAGGFMSNTSPTVFADKVHIYDYVSGSWSVTNMTQARAELGTTGAGEEIFWAGGYDSAWTTGSDDYVRMVNDIELYNIHTGSRSYHSFSGNFYNYGQTNDRVIFYDYTPSLHIYNINSKQWAVCYANLGAHPILISKGNTVYAVTSIVHPNGDFVQVWKLNF